MMVSDLNCEGPGLERTSGLLMAARYVSQTFILLILLHTVSVTKKPAHPCNLMSGLQSWSASIFEFYLLPTQPLPFSP